MEEFLLNIQHFILSVMTFPPLDYLVVPIAAICFIVFKGRRHKSTKIRTAMRVLFNKSIWLHPSSLLDFQFVFAGAILLSGIIAYFTFTSLGISEPVYARLVHNLGAPHAGASLPGYYYIPITLLLYLTYEFAYWLDHFLAHKIPFLWEFHKVHHSATRLTPFTNWRMHPVDTIIFLNIVAIVVGSMHGLLHYVFGDALSSFSILGINVVIAVYMMLYGHLQHSELWIPFTGLAGKIFMSPAHHQIHHSTKRMHFDKNFGSGLCLFDWMFGTLHMPTKQKEKLTFGTSQDKHLKALIPAMLYPFYYAIKQLQNSFNWLLNISK